MAGPEKLLTTKQVGEIFGVKGYTIVDWIHTKRIAASRAPNGFWRIKESEVNRLVQEMFGEDK